MFKHILCPIDGSQFSLQALDFAARFAGEQGAQLTICTVTNPAKAAAMAFGDPPMSAACLDALDDESKALVADAAARLKNVVNAVSIALDGQPVQTIAEYATEMCADLIVMGSHGRTGLKRAVLGSVAEGVLRKAKVPVMIARGAGRSLAMDGLQCSAS